MLGSRVLDIDGANAELISRNRYTSAPDPRRHAVAHRGVRACVAALPDRELFQGRPGCRRIVRVRCRQGRDQAPIKYPYNLLAIAANYRLHARRDVPARQSAAEGGRRGELPTKEDPVFFAKSPRSCIIDPGEPYIMPPETLNIDWEGELAIIIGRPAFNVSEANAHDYVFGYSIVYDISDHSRTGRPLTGMFPGPNWFRGKSRDRSAPFGPLACRRNSSPIRKPFTLSRRSTAS